jgi:DNA polymerase III sliding clamp (beta) subunit (PCNA family)
MQVKCETEHLLKYLQIADINNPEQKLYLEGADEHLVLETQFDGMTIKTQIPADVSEKGRIAVSAPLETLKRILTNIDQPDMTLSFNRESNLLSISIHGGIYSLFGIPTDSSSPSEDKGESEDVKEGVLERVELLNAFKRTLFAVRKDLASLKRRFFAGLLLELEEDEYALVGSDGIRMAIVRMKRPNLLRRTCEFKAGHAIPFPYCEKLIKVLEVLPSRQVCITQSERETIFDFGDVQVRCGLIPEGYPDYKGVIPRDKRLTIVRVDRRKLISALRAAEPLAPWRTKAVELEISDNTLGIRTASEEMGRSERRIPIRQEGENLSITVNVQMLIENLSHTDAGEVTMELWGPLSPILFRLEPNYSVIFMPMMPMRLPDERDI